MHRLLFTIFALLLTSAAPAPASVYCCMVIIKDNVLVVAYKPVIHFAPDCPAAGQARGRKSSTLDFRRNGAPYQHIRPAEGTWIVTWRGRTIPAGQLWTLLA
jgi:hypothetical protein